MLKDAILERGKALNQDILLVDSFLNHQVDVPLMKAIGEEFAKHFANKGLTRVVTIESSGISRRQRLPHWRRDFRLLS